MEVSRKNVGYAEGGRERQRVQGGRQRGRCRYVFPGRQGRGITRWDANTNACLRACTHPHTYATTQSHSLWCFKKEGGDRFLFLIDALQSVVVVHNSIFNVLFQLDFSHYVAKVSIYFFYICSQKKIIYKKCPINLLHETTQFNRIPLHKIPLCQCVTCHTTAVRGKDGYQWASVINHTISSGPHTRGQETYSHCKFSASSCPKFHMKCTLTAPFTVNQLVDKPHCEFVTVSMQFSQPGRRQGSNFKCMGQMHSEAMPVLLMLLNHFCGLC